MRYQPNVSPGVPIGFSPPVRVVDDAVDLDMASIGERASIGSVGGGGGGGGGGVSGAVPEHATKAEACAALQDGTVKCWSDGLKSSGGPVTAQGISNATHVAVGEFYGMARLATGAVVSFSNFYGQAALPVPSIP
ncbi:MAG: hypothetical protein IPG50_27920 [Myxococcales bacterium]|nr:hypothetical protein [Myxococcales bacterium]